MNAPRGEVEAIADEIDELIKAQNEAQKASP